MVGCRRGGRYTRLCDMWSLGASLYLILSGTFPFEGYDVQKKIKQVYSLHPSVQASEQCQTLRHISLLRERVRICVPIIVTPIHALHIPASSREKRPRPLILLFRLSQ